MMILGNSNVDCLARLGIHASAAINSVKVKWVGALKIQHFYENHAAATLIRELFENENDWKFLSIGTHDIYLICQFASGGHLDEALLFFLNRYTATFSELNKRGKFSWLVFPQPCSEVSFANLSPSDVLDIAQQFNTLVETWCLENGIPVINPFKGLSDPVNSKLKEFMQSDGLHLNAKGATIYLNEIISLTNIPLLSVNAGCSFEPITELESFCSLLLNNLGLQWHTLRSRQDFQNDLVSFTSKILKDRNIHIAIDENVNLVEFGGFDSLDLVNIYTYAANSFPMEIPFDVNLYEIDTISKIYDSLFEKFKSLNPNVRNYHLGIESFICSLRGNFDESISIDKVIGAESLISKMDDQLFNELTDGLSLACGGAPCPYGIPLLWVALCKAERGAYAEARVLLESACSAERAFPLRDGRAFYYRNQWQLNL